MNRDILLALIVFTLSVSAASAKEQLSRQQIESCEMLKTQNATIDRVRSGVFKGVCHTSRWFDGLFGNSEAFDGSKVRGWLHVGMDFDTGGGVKPRVRLNFHTDLPNANKRYNLFIGRVNEEEFVSNTQSESTGSRSTGFKSTEDEGERWMFGLGYRRPRESGVSIDSSIGAKVRSSGLIPYAKVRRYQQFRMPVKRIMSSSQTLFWREDEGFGFSADLLHEYVISSKKSIVLFPAVKYTSNENRWEWIVRAQYYRQLNDASALKQTWYVRDIDSIEDKGLKNELGWTVDYRKQSMRDWFFLVPSVTFSMERRDDNKDYEFEVFLGLRVEMEFDKNVRDYYRYSNRSR